MGRALSGAGLAAVIGLLVLGCGGGSSKGPVDLIFVSTRDGDYAIFGMSADGKHQRRLTAEHGNTSSLAAPYFQDEPAWSPDGRRIVFTSNRTGRFLLYVMRADGTGTRQLTSGQEDTHPTWSPDGKKLAFVRGPQEHLVTMNADGTGVHRVTDDAALEDDPAWSPNGQWTAYSRKAPGEEVRELWLVRPDGSRRHRLTSLNAVSTSPTWSPDSNRIAFESNAHAETIGLFVI